ncbi:MAG: GGDEF domain-containing protein [Gammaproteobacteria bacterium]
MTTDTKTQDAIHWKEKYFSALREYDSEEVRWKRTEDLLRQAVSHLALSAIGEDAQLNELLKEVRAAVSDDAGIMRLPDLLQQIADKLRQVVLINRQDKAPVSVETALVELLNRIPLPENLKDEAEHIRREIQQEKISDDWLSIIVEIAELVALIQKNTEIEKDSLGGFLSTVSERLKEVDSYLRFGDESAARGRANRGEMDIAVRREVEGISDCMREASEIGQLKDAVESQLESVVGHMNRFRDIEDQRDAQNQRELQDMSQQLEIMEEESKLLRQQVMHERKQATTDVLTQIPNRLAFEQRFEQEVASYKTSATPLVLLLWDVDHFKHVNDDFGHAAGDKVLKILAGILHRNIRGTDFTARLGGEEFVMLMSGSPIDSCLAVANKLRSLIRQMGFHFRGKEVVVTASCGLTEYRQGESLAKLLDRADRALYRAKEQGRNKCLKG